MDKIVVDSNDRQMKDRDRMKMRVNVEDYGQDLNDDDDGKYSTVLMDDVKRNALNEKKMKEKKGEETIEEKKKERLRR